MKVTAEEIHKLKDIIGDAIVLAEYMRERLETDNLYLLRQKLLDATLFLGKYWYDVGVDRKEE